MCKLGDFLCSIFSNILTYINIYWFLFFIVCILYASLKKTKKYQSIFYFLTITVFVILFGGTLYIINLNDRIIIFEKNLHYEDNSLINIYELSKSAVYKETSELNIDECDFDCIILNRSSDNQNIVNLYSTCERNQKMISASALNNNIRVLAIENKSQSFSFSFITNKEFYTTIKDLELMKFILSEVDQYDYIKIEVNPIKDIIDNIPDNQLDIKKLPGKENIGEAKFVLVVKVEYVGADDYDLLYYFK